MTWHPPQELNGYIIAYEVTYSVNGSQLITVNSTDIDSNFIVPELIPGTTTYISAISVSAYTKVGRGDATFHADVAASGNTGKLVLPRVDMFLIMMFCSCYSAISDRHFKYHIVDST